MYGDTNKMGKTAFLYAGQGSQITGMGKELYEVYPEFRNGFDAATLDFDLHKICFENPNNLLLQPEYTQPCIVAFACGVTNILHNNGFFADYACGLSLGEYSALYEAGVWDAKTAIETVAYRGKVMADASKGLDVAMYAIINLPKNILQNCCDKAEVLGVVSMCNFNCPGQIVIGGYRAAVEAAAGYAKDAGAKRCIPINVSGPFHTSLMKPAGDKLREYLAGVDFDEMKLPVMFNTLGREKGDEDIRNLLVKQIQSPVMMQSCIERLFELGVERFIEIGPGKVLSGFVKKIAKQLEIEKYEIRTIETVEDLLSL